MIKRWVDMLSRFDIVRTIIAVAYTALCTATRGKNNRLWYT